jgi:hypothetical protein
MTKRAINMSPEERKTALGEIKQRRPKLDPMDTSKKAADMTAQERAEWLAEHKRRFA